jgi:excisionase family DNA binding protein
MEQEREHSIESAPELFDINQASKFLNLKTSKLRSLIFKNQMPVIRIGKCLRFDKGDLMKWLKEMKCYSFEN